ncbi:MAG: sensor histidine kinase [Gammaproteobacteria bacterium]
MNSSHITPLPVRPERLLRSREHLFWFLHLFGWSSYAFVTYLGMIVYEKPHSYAAAIVASATTGMLFSLLLRYVYRKLWNEAPLVILVGAAAGSYVAALLWTLITNQFYWDLYKGGWRPESLFGYFHGVMGSTYVFLCWTGLYFGIKYHHMLQQQTEQTLKVQAAAHEAQLKMLRYQLNPHFLFNTLNAISTLILDRDTRRANDAVTRLSDFLRYTLDKDPMKTVSLRQELKALELYLSIEMVRFGERLRVKYDIEPLALEAKVPSLILQPIVENAVKYAVAKREEGGRLEIAATIDSGTLELAMRDDGPGLDVSRPRHGPSRGVGLRNTRERLHEIYGPRSSFTLSNRDGGGLEVVIRIPFET